jgi:hypothetical protein
MVYTLRIWRYEEDGLHGVWVNKMIHKIFHDNIHPMQVIILLTAYPALHGYDTTKVPKGALNLLELAKHSMMLEYEMHINCVITGCFNIGCFICSCKDLHTQVSELEQDVTLMHTSSNLGEWAELGSAVKGSRHWDGGRSSMKLATDPGACLGTSGGSLW